MRRSMGHHPRAPVGGGYLTLTEQGLDAAEQTISDELESKAVKTVNEQGFSQGEAAGRLSIPKGTVASRIAAAKSGTEN
jgi:DNA-directed RNA polymerase specialized sigma24 family protein